MKDAFDGMEADDIFAFSLASVARPLRLDSNPGDGYVDNWGTTDIWDYHMLYNVFSRGARVLD